MAGFSVYSTKRGTSVSTNTVHQRCKLLDCRVEDIIEYTEDIKTQEQDRQDIRVPAALFL